MLHRKHVSVEIRYPLPTLLGESERAQGVSNTRSHHFPKEICSSQILNARILVYPLIPVSRNSLNKAGCFRR